jgi:hypothetical protein
LSEVILVLILAAWATADATECLLVISDKYLGITLPLILEIFKEPADYKILIWLLLVLRGGKAVILV